MSFTLTVTGTGFTGQSVVRLEGVDKPTTFISHEELEATIEDSDIAELGELDVTVFNPPPRGGASAAAVLSVVASLNPEPVLTGISPDTIEEDSGGFTLTVTGTNFIATSVVRIGGVDRVTTYVDATELTAAILGTDIADPDTLDITVFNPSPGGGESAPQTLTVTDGSDPNFANVSALLHMNGTNGSTTFTDVKGKTWSPTVTHATIATAQSMFGGASALFGNDGRVTASTHADFGFGTGDYTIELWIRPTDLSGGFRGIIDFRSGTSTVAPNINFQAGGVIQFREAENNRITSASSVIAVNTWYHVAVTRSGNNTKMFVDGTQVGSTYSTNNDLGSTQPVAVGCYGAGVAPSGPFKFLGYIDDVRITKGVARYTANFTRPSKAFPDD